MAIKGSKLSEELKQQISNTMKGHVISEETKAKISTAKKGTLPSNNTLAAAAAKRSEKVIIDGKHYISMSEAGKVLNLSRSTIYKRIQSANFPTYQYDSTIT